MRSARAAALKNALGNVMPVAAAMHHQVQVAQGVDGEGPPKLGHQFTLEQADRGGGKSARNTRNGRPPRSTAQVASASSMGRVKWP